MMKVAHLVTAAVVLGGGGERENSKGISGKIEEQIRRK
jgi:hypothetical protein